MKNEISKISKANRESYQKLDSYYLEKKLKELIVKDNKIAHVEYILTSPEIKNINNEIIEKLFEFIVKNNKTELVKLMSLSLPIKNVLNINNLLIEAIKQNNISMVEYLLTSQDLKKRADIDYIYIRREIHGELTPLVDACRLGQMEIIDFLLNSPLLSKKADIEQGETPPFKMACIYNQPEVIKYLLTSPKLKKNIVLNEELSLTAYFAGLMRDLDLTYLILEYGMKIPKEERESLKRMNFDKANKINYLFEKKDLEDTLNKELEIRTTKNKIKI